jgi:hypothetical protein
MDLLREEYYALHPELTTVYRGFENFSPHFCF